MVRSALQEPDPLRAALYIFTCLHLRTKPFTEEQAARAREVATFLRAHGFWDERELVNVDIEGETFNIVDIGMRILTPRELFSVQGYIIELDYKSKPRDQIACCGDRLPSEPFFEPNVDRPDKIKLFIWGTFTSLYVIISRRYFNQLLGVLLSTSEYVPDERRPLKGKQLVVASLPALFGCSHCIYGEPCRERLVGNKPSGLTTEVFQSHPANKAQYGPCCNEKPNVRTFHFDNPPTVSKTMRHRFAAGVQ